MPTARAPGRRRRAGAPTRLDAAGSSGAVCSSLPYVLVFLRLRALPGRLRPVAGAPSGELRQAVRRPDLLPHAWSTRSSSWSSRINLKMVLALVLSGFFVQPRWWIKWLSLIFILPWAVPSIPTILSVRFMLNPEWGVINSTDLPPHRRRRPELAQRPDARARRSRCWCTSGSRCRSGR